MEHMHGRDGQLLAGRNVENRCLFRVVGVNGLDPDNLLGADDWLVVRPQVFIAFKLPLLLFTTAVVDLCADLF